eukprot:TRINITY_DN5343_c0_g1_i5.p2 TRINITY_DN5343_c0_g1~~TRINITY_DN5343_c0_g1_i5.p2  ORF type:complete len:189 (-),score=28.53 TRINITY_DN5343_c0_g1_i5:73-639(-)
MAVNIRNVMNLNRLSEKSTSKSNVQSHKHFPPRSVQYSPSRGESKDTSICLARQAHSRSRSSVSSSQIDKLKWQQVKLKRTLITLTETKQSTETMYLQLSNKEDALITGKEECGRLILKQERILSHALNEREKVMEKQKGISKECVLGLESKVRRAKRQCMSVRLINEKYKELLSKVSEFYNTSSLLH